jgi:hypothetical protein
MAIRFGVNWAARWITSGAVIPERVGVILAILLRGFSPQNIVYNYVHLCKARRKMYHSYPGDTAYTRECKHILNKDVSETRNKNAHTYTDYFLSLNVLSNETHTVISNANTKN